MISIALKDANGKADLTIDYQSGSIGITVVSDGKQMDFEMSFAEWELTTKFLKDQMNEKETARFSKL